MAEALTSRGDRVLRRCAALTSDDCSCKPANVPNGTHVVRAHLFRDGVFIAEKALPLRVMKTGLEQMISSAAHNNALAYGGLSVLLALLTGWLASVVFRKD